MCADSAVVERLALYSPEPGFDNVGLSVIAWPFIWVIKPTVSILVVGLPH